MKLEGIIGGSLIPQSKLIQKPAVIEPAPRQNFEGVLKYTDLTRTAFCGQIAQIKQAPQEECILDSTKISPIEGLEHSKEWPLPLAGLKKLVARFNMAKEFTRISENKTPMLSVYNLSSHGRVYGVYDILVNRLSLDEGIVLFDIDKTANIVDEALAHESYHCKRAQYFSRLSDNTVSKAIDNRISNALLTGNLPIYELMAGESLEPVNPEAVKLIVSESVKAPDDEISEATMNKLEELVPGYTTDSLRFFVKTVRRLRETYEKNCVIAYEPSIERNLFTIEKFAKVLPEKIIQRTMQSWGLPREEAVKKIIEQKLSQIIMRGYISPTEADKARQMRQLILKEHGVKEGSPEETTMVNELKDIFDMADAAFNLQLSSINTKVNDINKPKIQEEYMYSNEEINARQAGLTHKINLLKQKIETTPEDYKKRSLQEQVAIAEADYQLNETIVELKQLMVQKDQTPEVLDKIEQLKKQATQLAKKAEYTVPKVTGEKHQDYVPFSYGKSYRITDIKPKK